MAEPPGSDRIPTWRDGVVLTRQEKAELTPQQLQLSLDESVVRGLDEIEQMPEPLRSWARTTAEQARVRAGARIAAQEQRQAS